MPFSRERSSHTELVLHNVAPQRPGRIELLPSKQREGLAPESAVARELRGSPRSPRSRRIASTSAGAPRGGCHGRVRAEPQGLLQRTHAAVRLRLHIVAANWHLQMQGRGRRLSLVLASVRCLNPEKPRRSNSRRSRTCRRSRKRLHRNSFPGAPERIRVRASLAKRLPTSSAANL